MEVYISKDGSYEVIIPKKGVLDIRPGSFPAFRKENNLIKTDDLYKLVHSPDINKNPEFISIQLNDNLLENLLAKIAEAEEIERRSSKAVYSAYHELYPHLKNALIESKVPAENYYVMEEEPVKGRPNAAIGKLIPIEEIKARK